jgi:serine/threonine protein kinase/GTPase SAR1 family protein
MSSPPLLTPNVKLSDERLRMERLALEGASSSTELLSAILNDIGASEFLQNFIDDDQVDACIASYKDPNKVCKKYGLPQHLAASFVEKCRLSTPAPASAASSVDDASLLRKLSLEMVCQLGCGGFGTVYKCKNAMEKRLVAVKLMSALRNAKHALREGQKLLRAKHKNIVQLYRVHDLSPILGNGSCALEMELVTGGDLSVHLEAARRRPERRLPSATVLRLSRQLLQALVYLHGEMKWLHGDIKPQNMLLQCDAVPADGSAIDYSDAEIKLTDFGLTKVMDQEHSSDSFTLSNSMSGGHMKGTVWYMSPEALQGASSGHQRTYSDDLWSACLVIYEMDTGLTLQQLMTAPGAIKLEELLTKTSRELLPLLASVLAVPDAASRSKSAAELLQKLDASLDPLFIWEEYDAIAGKYACMHPAASFVLETAFLAERACGHVPHPFDLNFDIKALLSSATALGSATDTSGAQRAIRRLLKPSALTSSCEIPIWQQLVDGKEWLQCTPAMCAYLEINASIPSAAPDSKLYRRIILQPGSIGSAQLPLAMKSEPYCAPAHADDIAILSNRVHESLPEWDITDMVQVWNPDLASQYAAYRHRVAARCNGDPNERTAFHFASPFVMKKIWQEGEGHDPRLSNWAEVGKGSYFSKHPMYCYAYKYSLWPSPPGFKVNPEPPVGQTMQVFASLVCLGNVADMGPGCETCPSPAWDAWKREPPVMPKPTRPPAMTLPASAAEKQHVLDLSQVRDAPRYDSVTSSEGDLGTHPASTNKDASGRRICDVMHPRLRARAKEWGQQCVVFHSAASYPMFIVTLTKTRDFHEEEIFHAAYSKAVLSNGRPFRFSRLCLIGEGRAGKTALANALCNRTWVETDSTIGVGLNPHLQVMGTGISAASGTWEVVADEFVALEQNQLNWEAAQKLAGEPETEGRGIHERYVGTTFGSQNSNDPDSLDGQLNSKAQQMDQLQSLASLQQDIVSSLPDGMIGSHAPAVIGATAMNKKRTKFAGAPITEMDIAMIMKLKGQPEPLRMNLLDFGGQDAFDNLHHLYVTRASVYLLVFNMECMIGSKSTAETRQHCIRRLSFWLNSIYLHARGTDASKQEGFSVAPVILVGTHKDKVPDAKDHESIKQILDREFDSSPLWRHVVPFHGGTVSTGRGLLNFFPVDNKQKQLDGDYVDDVVRAIQAAVQKRLEEEEYLKAKVPLQWLRVFDALMLEKEQCDMPFKFLTDVEQIASGCGLPFCGLSLQEEVLRMLKYFNDLGLLMYHDCPSLRHIIVLDTFRCLVNPASIVMCQHDIHKLPVHLEAKSDCGEDFVQLTTCGVLNSNLLQILWKGKDTASIIDEITELMVHYGLMLPLHSPDLDRTYLVPSLFPEARLPVASSACSQFIFAFGTEKRIKMWERSGHFSAQDVTAHGFCPNGLFSRLTGKIISECQRIYNFPDSKYSRHEISTTFGRLKFVARELKEHHMIQVLVLVETPITLLENLTRLLQESISELIPNLAFCTAVPVTGSLGDSTCLADAHFAVLSGTNGVLECSKHNRDFNAGDGSLLTGAQLRKRFGIWLPPSGLKARYHVFLSYRWTGKIEDDLTLGLFNNLSADVLGSGRGIDVFLDKRRLEDGRNFQDDFADALLNSQFPVVVMSTEALKRMVTLEAKSDIDNLLLEWTLILELLHLKKINMCLPIFIGTYNQSASTCADTISDFFNDKMKLSDGKEYKLFEALPGIPVTSIIEKVRSILKQHSLSESPQLSGRTVRDVVQQLSRQQGVMTWTLFSDPILSACPATSVKDEVIRTVIRHCASKTRGILDSSVEERAQYQFKSTLVSDSALARIPATSSFSGGGSAAAQEPLASMTSHDVAAAIGRIGASYLPYQQIFIDDGVDGTMLVEWSVESDSDLLEMLTVDLKIANKIHRTRVLRELKMLWAPSW